MAIYSFKDTTTYFLDLLKVKLPEEIITPDEPLEMEIDQFHVVLIPLSKGGIRMQLNFGLLLHPVRLEKLQMLCKSNFLGVDTGGCTLALDPAGVSLLLKLTTTPYTSPQENWEFLHRLLTVAKAWQKNLLEWEEFIPLI